MDWLKGGGSILSALGGIASAAVSADQANKQDLLLSQQKAKNDSWFNKEYYQNALDRSENAQLLKQLNEKQNDAMKVARSRAVVTGATPEVVLAEQQNLNNAYANAMGEIAKGETMRKEGVYNKYNQRDIALTEQQRQRLEEKAKALGTVSDNAVTAMSNLLKSDNVADVLRGLGKKKQTSTTTASSSTIG
jgi:hypothetical protein